MTAGILLALLAGLLARTMFPRNRPGVVFALLAGVIGALAGSPVAHRVSGAHEFHAFRPESFIVAFAGAVLLVWGRQLLRRRTHPKERRIFS